MSTRDTRSFPSKSGVLGLVAAALGRDRTAPLDDLQSLKFGTRIEQRGIRLYDFQTESFGAKNTISYRYYLSDWRFLAALSGEDSLICEIGKALASPIFPLYLGRRSCPPSAPVYRETVEAGLGEVLQSYPWLAADRYKKNQGETVSLSWFRDLIHESDVASEVRPDEPVSFDSKYRQYRRRGIVHGVTSFRNPASRFVEAESNIEHDEFALLGGE